MATKAWLLVSVSLGSLCAIPLFNSSPGKENGSLSKDEMQSTCGGHAGGCVLSAPLSDCNQTNEVCGTCMDSMSRETLEGMTNGKVRLYLGADRKICKTPTVANTKTCDPGTVTCWSDRSCDRGAIQTDKSCNANQTSGSCATPNTEGTWFCANFTLGPVVGSKTKNDDDCI